MSHVAPTLAVLLLALTGLGGCLSSAPALTGGPGAAMPTRAAALRGSIAPVGSLKLSQRAEQEALVAEYQALQFGPVGQPVGWEADGVRGEFVPTQLYRVGSQDCRGFTHVITKGETRVKQVGSACRSGDDLWTPVA